MYMDPMLTIIYHQAETRRAMVEAERRRVAAERSAAAKAEAAAKAFRPHTDPAAFPEDCRKLNGPLGVYVARRS